MPPNSANDVIGRALRTNALRFGATARLNAQNGQFNRIGLNEEVTP